MESYIYCGLTFNTEAELHEGIEEIKAKLENNPTEYMRVEQITENPEGGWIMSGIYLSDTGINNLQEDQHYSVFSGYTGENCVGLTKDEVEVKKLEMRRAYGQALEVNKVEAIRVFEPTNVDMSGYV
jgi:hypothetical protein